MKEKDRPLRILSLGATVRVLKGELFLHRSLTPLDEADLSTAQERGQINMFSNECEGMCGV